jgi:hypothetical protein
VDPIPQPTLPWWLEWWWQRPLGAATAHPLIVALTVLVVFVLRVVPWWRERRFLRKYRPGHVRTEPPARR